MMLVRRLWRSWYWPWMSPMTYCSPVTSSTLGSCRKMAETVRQRCWTSVLVSSYNLWSFSKYFQMLIGLLLSTTRTHVQYYSSLATSMSAKEQFILALLLLTIVAPRCVYRVLDDGKPEKVDAEPHIVEGMTQCLEWNGKPGCCDVNNDASQVGNYVQIDGVFGSKGGGCDLCAINMKRFWCEYACSPRQHEFMTSSKEFYPYPSPSKPDQTVYAQRINLTIHADSACDIFNSCKRVGFVSAVSAMSSPAGFLTFQGHNALDAAFQWIDVDFSYDKTKSMTFSDDKKDTQPERASFQKCNYTTSDSFVHGFEFLSNCSCNNCEDSCNSNDGFVYTESGVFEGFNWILVLSVWTGSIAVVAAITHFRKRKEKSKDQ